MNAPRSGLRTALAKYRNVKTTVDGVLFDSKKEARRGSELALLERAGEIRFVRRQEVIRLEVNGLLICKIIPDFVYVRTSDDVQVWEDVKSPITRKNPVYRLKKKLLKALHGIDLVEV